MTTRPMLLLLVACLTPVPNPTGTCLPDDDGGRACYHVPDASDTYLLDCDAPLDRELWRVFAIDEETAYIIPRPDATGLSYGICDGEDADLADLFDRTGLCNEVANPNQVNALDPADALAVTHALHERLVFTANDDLGTPGIYPWAPDSDMGDACDLLEDGGPPICDWFRGRRDVAPDGACTDEAWVPDQESVDLIVPALNQLYGIVVE